MQSIIYKGIFTSQGFLAIILLAFGLFMLFKTNRTVNSHTDVKIYLVGIASMVAGIYYLIVYISQIRHFFV